ncbi:MAG: glycosyltransferase [Calditrichia bacterium]
MKKVLIITYYWPPAGGPGVQRVLKFARLLPQFGWQPIVLTVEDGDYPAMDESLLQKVPESCRVYRTSILEPYKIYRKLTGKQDSEKLPTFVLNENKNGGLKNKIATWVRANVFIPDARIGWIPKATHEGKRILKEENIDLIFASSPPHTVQLIAKKLAKHSGVPWVADFRDPWTEAFWSASLKKNRFSSVLDARLEKGVLKSADAVITVSEGVKDMLGKKAENRYEVIQNGFEPLQDITADVDTFSILFIGSLSNYQNPEPLFKSIDSLPSEMQGKVSVSFVGRTYKGFDELFNSYSHLDIQRLPYMAHSELMQFAKKSALLFRPVAQSAYADKNVGAKTYDYLALRKPILTLGVKPSVSQHMLKETASGELFTYDDIPGIAGFLQRWYAYWQANGTTLLANEENLAFYTSEYQVGQLARLFEELSDKKLKKE